MQDTKLETFIVPWFSRQEWLDVYHGAFSNDVDRWKEARDTMLVWEARVHKLPVGVHLTLPLLQAKIVYADPLVDSDVKSIMQGTALQRFVSNVVKLPQTKFYHNQGMHKLAAHIGLPAHLVDLRNEIVHGDSGWTGGCTIVEALETSYKWIKDYYWYPEWNQMIIKPKSKCHRLPKGDWQYFLDALDLYAKAYDRSGSNKGEISLEANNHAIETFGYFCSMYQEDCIEAIVMHLFLPDDMSEKMFQPSGKKAECGCFFNSNVVNVMDRILNSLLMVEGSLELLIACLISKAEENKEVVIEWIYLIIASFIDLPSKKGEKDPCRQHLLHVNTHSAVNWQSVIYKLLNAEQEWASNLALRVMNAPETNFSELQAKQIDNLVKLVKFNEKDVAKQIANMCEITDADLYDINSLVDESQKHSANALMTIQKIKSSVFPSASLTSSTVKRTPLGILPHQMDNKDFYKELLLHYPGDRNDEPPLKRKKT